MKVIFGSSNKVLEVDLSKQETNIYTIPRPYRKQYLGAKGLGLKLLFERLEPKIDPLSDKNIIAIMPGVLMGTGAPCSGRFAAVTKSPLTGLMLSSSCGGPFGMYLKTAGWDGLLIRGKSKKPVQLIIDSKGVTFKDASDLWGLTTKEAQAAVVKSKTSGALIIGPAGENLVRFANVASGHRFLGRGGLGAVFGSKNLKAVLAIGGEYKIKPIDVERFDRINNVATRYINNNDVTSGSYRTMGTSSTVNLCNAGHILPVNNFKSGSHDKAYAISGEYIREKYNTKYQTCRPCSILCGHKGKFDGKMQSVPEYETLVLLGSNLGIFDADLIARWNGICGELGMDTISTGGTLAWLMEATEKGKVKTNLAFGNPEGIEEMLDDIAHANGFGKEVGLGSRALSEKYGGRDFAIQTKGLELAAYDPRGSYGMGLAYAVANRGGCHLSAYVVAQEVFFGLLNPYATKAKPQFTRFFESLTACINSMQTCVFSMFAYTLEVPLTKFTPKPMLGFLMQNVPDIAVTLVDYHVYTDLWSSITGIEMSNSEFITAGDRIHTLERYMNTREGISRKDDTLPPRLLNEGRLDDPKKRTVPIDKMIDHYYKLRGYDSNGIPTHKTLKRLNIL